MSSYRRHAERSRNLRTLSNSKKPRGLRRFAVETLEGRRLLDASEVGGPIFDFDSETGILSVATTENDDVVTASVVNAPSEPTDPVEQRTLEIEVETGGATFSWSGPYREVTAIQFDLDAGDDTLLVREAVGKPIIVDAGSGNDRVSAGGGGARIAGGDGDDNIVGSPEDDAIDAGSGDDHASGNEGNDFIQGGWGNDYLAGGTGNDTIVGDPGDWDRLDPIPTPDPDETPQAVDGEVLPGDAAVAIDYRGNDVIRGEEGNDRLHGMLGDDDISGGDDFDGIHGGTGNDAISGGDEPYIVYIRPGPVGDKISGGRGNDKIDAGNGDDAVSGDEGNDAIQGGWGSDWLSGGDGSDVVIGDPGDLSVDPVRMPDNAEHAIEAIVVREDDEMIRSRPHNDHIEGGEGSDRLHGMFGDDAIDGGGWGDGIHGGSGNDTISGGDEGPFVIAIYPPVYGGDRIDGGLGNDQIDAGEGDDYVSGGEGNDAIQGGWGNDALDGDGGNDVIVGDPGDIIRIDPVPVPNEADYRVVADVVAEPAIVPPPTRGADRIRGGDGNDRIAGMYGNDAIEGGSGFDGISGGSGDDRIDGGDEPYIVYVQNGGNVLPNAGNVPILPGPVGDKISGGHGNDAIDAGRGDDYVSGGEGDDQIQGGWGNDVLDGDDGSDQIVGDPGDVLRIDPIPLPEPTDGLIGVEGVLVDPDQVVVFRANDVIRGGNDGDRIHGMAGNDVISGGDASDGINAGSGNDTVTGDGGGDKIFGGLGNDNLDGGAGDDYVAGAEGDDAIQGGWDNDHLSGGEGSDELVGDPRDLVPTPIPAAYAIAAHVVPGEPLDPNDTANVRGNDSIYGDTGDDRIHGMYGHDVISGGRGHDGIDGGSGGDEISGDTGNDKLLGGIGNDSIDGGYGNDLVGGGVGNDLLQGGWGDDEIHGGDGNDSIVGDPGDVDEIDATPDPDSNQDVPTEGEVIRNDPQRISRLRGNDLIYGDAGNDRINGMFGNDRIRAGAGNDGVAGGSGSDRIAGGEGNDRIHGNRGRDRLLGGADDDRVVGGGSSDYIAGDEGADGLHALDGVVDAICRDNQDAVNADPEDVFLCLPGPVMESVRVRSTRWSNNFENRPAENNAAAHVGGEIDIAGDGTTTIPWANINQIVIAFDSDVSLDASSLIVEGMGGRYGMAAFRYDAATFTATWTLDKEIDGDKIALAVVDRNGGKIGNGLDVPPELSTLANDSSTSFHFNVAAGDVNGDGVVDVRDVRQAAARGVFSSVGDETYVAAHDFDGDGSITLLDVIGIRNSQGTRLGSGTPSLGAPAAAGAIVVAAPEVRAADRVLTAVGIARADRRQDVRRSLAEDRPAAVRASVDAVLAGEAATQSTGLALRARRALRVLAE